MAGRAPLLDHARRRKIGTSRTLGRHRRANTSEESIAQTRTLVLRSPCRHSSDDWRCAGPTPSRGSCSAHHRRPGRRPTTSETTPARQGSSPSETATPRRPRRGAAGGPHRRRPTAGSVLRDPGHRRRLPRERRSRPGPRGRGRGSTARTRRGRPQDRRPRHAARQGRLRRAQLPRPRRRDRRGHTPAPRGVHEGPGDGRRPLRRGADPARVGEDRLGGRTRRRHRTTGPLPRRPPGRAGRDRGIRDQP